MNTLHRLFGLFFLLLLPACGGSSPAVSVEQAWVREAPPGAPVLGAFMQIRNTLDRPLRLVSAGSEAAERVEMHRSLVEDGMARMQELEFIELPAGGTASLEPGGMHLMLIGPRQAVREGDEVLIRLHFDDIAPVEVRAEVRRDTGETAHQHHHH